jgi:hypothetical protein
VAQALDKKAHIRGYLMLLLGEGTFARAKTPTEVVMRASAAFARDVGEVIGEMATEFGAAGANKISTTLAEVGGRVVADLAGRFLDNIKRRS